MLHKSSLNLNGWGPLSSTSYLLMLPSCTTCVPSCSLFPRSAGGKVMLPPLTSGGSSHDCAMMNSNSLEGWKKGVHMHPHCSCHHEDCLSPSSSSGRPLLRNKPARNCLNGHNRMDTHTSITARGTSLRQPPISTSTPIPSAHDRKTLRHPTTVSQPIDVTSQQAASKADLVSSVRTFRFKNTSMHANRRGTKSPSRRSSPSDTDGSLKEINVTRRARRQIYLKPDVEGSPFRLLMYVDCRSVESPQQMDET